MIPKFDHKRHENMKYTGSTLSTRENERHEVSCIYLIF